MHSRPKLLAVSSELPWPLNSGGHLRTFHLLKAIAQRFEVHLVAAGPAPDPSAVAALGAAGITAEVVVLPPRTAVSEALKAGWCGAIGRPYVLYGRHVHRRVRTRVRSLCERIRPSVLYLDHLDAYNYRSCFPDALAVADLHNVYSLIAGRWADERSGLVGAYLRREAALLRSAEREAAADVDVLFAVSSRERDYYEGCGARNVCLVPNGVDSATYRELPVGRDTSLIVYIGSMSWRPNADAAKFLASTVLPRVRLQIPNARLRIIGRDPGPELLSINGTHGVDVTGEVPSMLPHLSEGAVLAVPLQAGGGTRLKILEALAAGLPVVSTPVGAEGLDLVPGVHLLVVDRDDFADGLVQLLTDSCKGKSLAAAGRAVVQDKYDWSTIGAYAAKTLAAAL